MTKSVNVHQAKTHLSRLLDEALEGEEIIIARAGVPCVRLVPVVTPPRVAGLREGVWPDLPPDSEFFAPLPDDELAAWER